MMLITMRHLFRHCAFRIQGLLPGIFILLVSLAAPHAFAVSDAKQAVESDLFDGTNIVKITITVPEAGLQALRRTGWGGGGGGNRPEAKATVTDGTTTYRDVSIHLKGAKCYGATAFM